MRNGSLGSDETEECDEALPKDEECIEGKDDTSTNAGAGASKTFTAGGAAGGRFAVWLELCCFTADPGVVLLVVEGVLARAGDPWGGAGFAAVAGVMLLFSGGDEGIGVVTTTVSAVNVADSMFSA